LLRRQTRLWLTVVVVTLGLVSAASATFAVPAQAIELPEPIWRIWEALTHDPHAAFEHLPDGDYGFVEEGKVLDEYSASEKFHVEAILNEMVEKGGAYDGPEPEAFDDYSFLDDESAEDLLGKIRDGGVYATEGEELVGDGLVGAAETFGSLPSLATVMGAVGSVGLVGGAAFAGVAIGNGIDELFGLPTVSSLFSETENQPEEGASYPRAWQVHKLSGIGEVTGATHCEAFAASPIRPFGFDLYKPGYCLGITTEWEDEVYEQRHPGEEPVRTETRPVFFGPIYEDPFPYGDPGSAGAQEQTVTEEGFVSQVTYWVLDEDPGACFAHHPPPRGSIARCGYPSHFETLPTPVAPHVPVTSPEEVRSLPTPTRIVSPTEVPAAVPMYILHEEETRIPPLEGPAPDDPTRPEIPPVESDELYTHYKARVEQAGFTDVQENVLPDSQIDTSVGPNAVASVAPDPGTQADSSTQIRVDVNPEDAPNPAEAGSVVGPPAEPGIDFPNLGVLCTKFPFGVPCWLVEEVSEWSGTKEVPTWDIPLEVPLVGFHVNLPISLAPLEPAMEIIRPVLVALSTVGLVLLFFRFAMAGGGGPDGGDE
jgi:hypothetical protein